MKVYLWFRQGVGRSFYECYTITKTLGEGRSARTACDWFDRAVGRTIRQEVGMLRLKEKQTEWAIYRVGDCIFSSRGSSLGIYLRFTWNPSLQAFGLSLPYTMSWQSRSLILRQNEHHQLPQMLGRRVWWGRLHRCLEMYPVVHILCWRHSYRDQESQKAWGGGLGEDVWGNEGIVPGARSPTVHQRVFERVTRQGPGKRLQAIHCNISDGIWRSCQTWSYQ